MKIGICLLTILMAPCAFALGLAGTWEGTFSDSAKSYAGFDLDVTGDQVTGAAFLSGWGYGEIAGGRVAGNRFTFSVQGVAFEGLWDGDTISLRSLNGQYAAALVRTRSQATGPISAGAAAKDLEGMWKTRWVGRISERPKMIGGMRIEFRAEGNALTGVAHMDGWPGDCPITDGKFEAGRFSFTATGLRPSSSGIPVMRFEGEMHGKQLKLTMRHQIFGADNGVGLPMDAERN